MKNDKNAFLKLSEKAQITSVTNDINLAMSMFQKDLGNLYEENQNLLVFRHDPTQDVVDNLISQRDDDTNRVSRNRPKPLVT